MNPTDGDKEIQRQSRIQSLGNLTISTELARRVACGELSLDEAIRIANPVPFFPWNERNYPTR